MSVKKTVCTTCGSRMPASRHANVRGTRNPAAKLNDVLVRSIRAEYARGDTAAAIAVRIGVSEGAVRSVLAGRYWSHVR